MIEGASSFTFLGLALHDNGAMLVFREGGLMVSPLRSGWGALRRDDLRRLLPPGMVGFGGSSRYGRDPVAPDAIDHDRVFAGGRSSGELSTASSEDSTSSSASGSRSPSPSPRRAEAGGGAPPPAWVPPARSLGWHPSDTAVVATRVTQQTLDRIAAADTAAQRAVLADAMAGRLPAPSDTHPAAGVLVGMTVFGEPVLMTWPDQWWPADAGGQAPGGFSADLARALVAHARVAPACELAAIEDAIELDFLGALRSPGIELYDFDRGLLVLAHPEPGMQGWHDMRFTGASGFLSRGTADHIDKLADSPYTGLDPTVDGFLTGNLHERDGTDFCALVILKKTQRWRSIHVAPPLQWTHAGDPQGPTPAEVDRALARAVPAPLQDPQFLPDQGPMGLDSGAWRVDWLLGALRLLAASRAAPALLRDTWHATLQPALQALLQPQRALEPTWLAQGRIRQPIDGLIALSLRDTRLRRPEVQLCWPATAVADLFRILAPNAPVRVVPAPTAAAVDAALDAGKPVLVLFQSNTSVHQAAALAIRGWCYSTGERVQFDTNRVKARAHACGGPPSAERIVALVFAG